MNTSHQRQTGSQSASPLVHSEQVRCQVDQMFALSWPAGSVPVGQLSGKSDTWPHTWGRASDRSIKDEDSDTQLMA